LPGLQKWPEAKLPTIFENPGQGDNPNIALTRPQAIGPLTLVGQWSGGVTHRETPSTFNNASKRPLCKVVI
jgi:hypothetical protein